MIKNKFLVPMVREIGWTYNLVILEKCKDELESKFYIKMARKFGCDFNTVQYCISRKGSAIFA